MTDASTRDAAKQEIPNNQPIHTERIYSYLNLPRVSEREDRIKTRDSPWRRDEGTRREF